MSNKIVEIAEKELGYAEEPGNITKYGKWFGKDGMMWCAIFVSWCYSMAGRQLPKIGWLKGFAGCQMGYEYFKAKGWITTDPQPGDIVLFDWNKDGRHDHTGIFVDWHSDAVKNSFFTIEGNTSLTNQSNGGSVMKRTRNYRGKYRVTFVHVPEKTF